MSKIHPTAIVDPKAELDASVEVGPFCYIGPGVKLAAGCTLGPRVTLLGPSEFGPRNVFYPGCVLGAAPQDLKYRGGPTSLVVGSDNIFREHSTVHRGTEVDPMSEGVTRIGSHNLIMVGVHVAHDSDLGNHIIIANAVQLAGHIRIEDCVVIGGASAMHHFVTVGQHAYIAGVTRVFHDVLPYVKVFGYEQSVRGLNLEGLRRWKVPDLSIKHLRHAARLLFDRRNNGLALSTVQAIREIETSDAIADDHVRYLIDSLKRQLECGVHGRVREHQRRDTAADIQGFYGRRAETGALPAEGGA